MRAPQSLFWIRNDGAFVNRGIAYRRRGDLDLAIRDYTEAIRLNPRAADAFNNRGNAYQNSGDFERALADYDEAIRLNPAYAHAYNNRGVALAGMRRFGSCHRRLRSGDSPRSVLRKRPPEQSAGAQAGWQFLYRYRLPAASCQLPATGYQLPATSYRLQAVIRERPDDERVLPEAILELFSKCGPPRMIQIGRHHFENHDIVSRRLA